MIKDRQTLERFEMELIRKTKVNLAENFRLFDAMYQEARALGVIPMRDPLDGIEFDIKIARVVNGIPKST